MNSFLRQYLDLGLFWCKKLDVKFSSVFIKVKTLTETF